jgi:hypothetical protein
MCDTLLEDCSICLEYIINDDSKQKTVCHHTFHADCLTRWTQANNSCPLCRTGGVAPSPPTASAGETDVAYVPLPFWFNRDERLIIPEVAYNHSMSTVIDISFAALSDLELADLTIENDNEAQPLMNNYSFALEPELPQPSGTQNRSRIGDVRLNYHIAPFNMFPESYVPSGSVNRARVAY